MATMDTATDQVVPTAAELEQALRDLPERWLPIAGDVAGWAERWLAAWNAHDLAALTELVTEDVVWDDPAMFGELVRSREDFRRFTADFFQGIPDVRFEPNGPACIPIEGVGLTVPWRMVGTFTGEMPLWGKRFGDNPPALAPTGRRIDIKGVDVYELRDGLLARWDIHYDFLLMSQQLGLMPPIGGRLAALARPVQRLSARVMRGRGRR